MKQECRPACIMHEVYAHLGLRLLLGMPADSGRLGHGLLNDAGALICGLGCCGLRVLHLCPYQDVARMSRLHACMTIPEHNASCQAYSYMHECFGASMGSVKARGKHSCASVVGVQFPSM